MSVDEKRLRFPDASGLGSTFRKEPELGVDEGSGSDRIFQSLLQWEWDSHGQGGDVHNVRILRRVQVIRGSGEADYL